MEVPAKRMKITADIWDCMLDFLTEHPEMVTGKFSGPNGKERQARLWKELAEKLNALGCGIKTATKWQKSFTDWKYNIKQKYAEIKTQRTKTGGGPQFYKNLTPQEERLIGLIGLSAIEGDGTVEEIGLPPQVTDTEPSTSLGSHSTSYSLESMAESQDIIMVSQLSPQLVEIVIPSRVPSPSTSGPSRGSSITPEPTTIPIPGPSTSAPHQLRSNIRLQERLPLECFQAETMEVLRSINEQLRNLSENMQRLTDAVVAYLGR